MVQPSLEDIKVRLSQLYLGKDGIHGLGVSRAQQAIKVYLSPEADGDSILIGQLREDARPYPLVIIHEERPSAKEGKTEPGP